MNNDTCSFCRHFPVLSSLMLLKYAKALETSHTFNPAICILGSLLRTVTTFTVQMASLDCS